MALLFLTSSDVSVMLLLLFTFLLLFIFHWNQKRKNLPPGPPGIPIFGNLLQLKDKNLLQELALYREKYGDIFKIQLGACLVIVVNGNETIKKVFQTKGDEFYNRPDNFMNLHVIKHLGIITNNNQSWKEQRAFGTSTLRHFGVGKKSIEIPIVEECESLISEIKKYNKDFDIKNLIQNATANIICAISFGKRYDYGEKKFTDLAKKMDKLVKCLGSLGKINAFPFMRFFCFDWFDQKQIKSIYNHIINYMEVQINEHQQSIDLANPRDLIDLYILEMKKTESGSYCKYNEDHLSHILADIFVAGTETTATVIRWALLYLLYHPSIQKNLHKEIDSVIGSKVSTLQDKKEMPFMSAFIEEVMRIAVVSPLAFEHAPTTATTIDGFVIPKDAVIVPNLYSAAHDPNVFPEPETFMPTRFLDAKGHFHPSEKSIPFSVGRRVCLGESLAKTEIFLFLTSLLQQFEFVKSETGLPSLQGILGGTYAPKPFLMKALSRI